MLFIRVSVNTSPSLAQTLLPPPAHSFFHLIDVYTRDTQSVTALFEELGKFVNEEEVVLDVKAACVCRGC